MHSVVFCELQVDLIDTGEVSSTIRSKVFENETVLQLYASFCGGGS